MSNTHEYVIFDRAKLDPALAMKWSALERAHPAWGQFGSARDFLVEWGLDQSHVGLVDEILARKTVRGTLALSDTPFLFLHVLLDEKRLWECGAEIEKGDYDYADDIVSCAGAGYVRGDLSLASLTAVYHLHSSRVELAQVFPPDVARLVQNQPAPAPMLPGFPDLMQTGADGLGVGQSRRFIEFLVRAWKECWPLHGAGQNPRTGATVRSCGVGSGLVQSFKKRRLAKPCIYRWYEC